MKLGQIEDESISDGRQLSGDNRQYRDVNTIELIKTTPGTTLAQTRKYLANSL